MKAESNNKNEKQKGGQRQDNKQNTFQLMTVKQLVKMLEKFCSISFSMRGIPTNTENINYITQKYKYWDMFYQRQFEVNLR